MRMFKFFSFTLVAIALFLTAGTAFGQAGVAPASQFGIGVFAGGNITGGGFSLQYAINPSFQIGLDLGVMGVSRDGASTTNYSTEIHGRFLFEGAVNPFVQAGFRRTSQEVSNGTGTTTTADGNQLYGGFGLEYFFNRNVGVYAMIDVINLNFDPSSTVFGINDGRVGVEWYFNP